MCGLEGRVGRIPGPAISRALGGGLVVRINMVTTGAGRSGPEDVASNRDRGALALRIAAAVAGASWPSG